MRINWESSQRVVLHLDGISEDVFVESSVPFSTKHCDFAVWLGLMRCMSLRIPLVIDGPVTDTCVFNAGILQQILCRYGGWQPVDIRADVVHVPEPEVAIGGRIIVPFSGGIDSAFTVLYNVHEMKRPVHAAFFCAGLDIPWRCGEEVNLACKKCEYILGPEQIPLIRLRTNYRDVCDGAAQWTFQSDVVLAGLLHLFDGTYRHGLISGASDGGADSVTRSFELPKIPERLHSLFTGSTMLIDSYTGAFHSKIQRTGYVCQFPEVRQNLRVCWMLRNHENCCQCRKCFISQLMVLANIGYIPSCFQTPITAEMIRRTVREAARVEKEGKDRYQSDDWYYVTHRLSPLLETAKQTGVGHVLLDVLTDEMRAAGFVRREDWCGVFK